VAGEIRPKTVAIGDKRFEKSSFLIVVMRLLILFGVIKLFKSQFLLFSDVLEGTRWHVEWARLKPFERLLHTTWRRTPREFHSS
jgi:hypothetical protein